MRGGLSVFIVWGLGLYGVEPISGLYEAFCPFLGIHLGSPK